MQFLSYCVCYCHCIAITISFANRVLMCVNAHSRGEMAKSRCTFSVHVGVGLNSGVMYTPISVLKPSYFSPLPAMPSLLMARAIMPALCVRVRPNTQNSISLLKCGLLNFMSQMTHVVITGISCNRIIKFLFLKMENYSQLD